HLRVEDEGPADDGEFVDIGRIAGAEVVVERQAAGAHSADVAGGGQGAAGAVRGRIRDAHAIVRPPHEGTRRGLRRADEDLIEPGGERPRDLGTLADVGRLDGQAFARFQERVIVRVAVELEVRRDRTARRVLCQLVEGDADRAGRGDVERVAVHQVLARV